MFLMPQFLWSRKIAPHSRTHLPHGANVSHNEVMKNAPKPIPPLTDKVKRHFWSGVDRSLGAHNCWPWKRAKTSNGYGHMRLQGRIIKTHRIAYSLFFGEIPDRLDVLHRCDNPSCNNPSHLFAGTHLDNMRDMYSKGRRIAARGDATGLRVHPERAPMGERNGQAKLTESIVIEIRRCHEQEHIGCWCLSKLFSISRSQIKRIIRGHSWAYLTPTNQIL